MSTEVWPVHSFRWVGAIYGAKSRSQDDAWVSESPRCRYTFGLLKLLV